MRSRLDAPVHPRFCVDVSKLLKKNSLAAAAVCGPRSVPRFSSVGGCREHCGGLGHPDPLIAGCTGITSKTVTKAIRWFHEPVVRP